jgi:regulation of enolase protein 1 (concanavalin A-like superfamily)
MINTRIFGAMGDSIDIVSCQKVLLDGLYIERGGDDHICLKNEGRGSEKYGFLCEDIIIANTTVKNCLKEHPAVKIGTGTAGVFRNIIVHDCIFENMETAFCIQLMRPTVEKERMIENVRLSNLVVKNCRYPVDVTQMDVARTTIRNLTFDHIYAEGCRDSSRIVGSDGACIETIQMSDVVFGKQNLAPGKPLFSFDYVKDLSIHDCTQNGDESVMFALHDCNDVRVRGIDAMPGAKVLALAGEKTEEILMALDGCRRGSDRILVQEEVAEDAISPVVRSFLVSGVAGQKEIACGSGVAGSVRVQNLGGEGFLQLPIYARYKAGAEDEEVGRIRTWMQREEVREICFVTQPLYRPGEYEICVGGQSFVTRLAQAPAQIKVSPKAVLSATADGYCVEVSAQNVGGTKDVREICMECAGETVASALCELEPGEEKKWILCSKEMPSEDMPLQISGVLDDWRCQIAADTQSCYEVCQNRISITAGGKLYSANGRYEYEHFMESAALYRRIEGDFVATVRVISQDFSGQYAAAGLVVCNDMQKAGSEKEAVVAINNAPKYGSMGVWRADCDGDCYAELNNCFSTKFGYYFRLEKEGKTFRGYTSPDGDEWLLVTTVTVPNANTVQDIGIFAFSNSVTEDVGTAVFEDFTVDIR